MRGRGVEEEEVTQLHVTWDGTKMSGLSLATMARRDVSVKVAK